MIKNILRHIRRFYKHRVIALMYHRIASPETDPWQIAVSPENFEQHLEVLRKNYKVISVTELARQLKKEKIEDNSICLTFDDAYADNYLYAGPLLKKYGLPATFFVPSQYIGSNKLFWWDELENIILHSIKLPLFLSLYIDGELFKFTLDKENLTQEDRQRQSLWIWSEKAPTRRCELYFEIWKRLRPLTTNDIEPVLMQIKEWAVYQPCFSIDSVAMSHEQLIEMFNEPLFSIGLHTLTHPALACHSKDVQMHEIKGCKEYLENALGATINALAYPYGNYNYTTLAVVKEQNLSVAFTTETQAVTKASDRHKLGRLQIVDQNGQSFRGLITRWMKE